MIQADEIQQLPGYTLIDRLGAGGYGEVWRAEAPGGLTKAVKYVYGRQDEKRASSEWKALERIKEVRHPFLLSLERIEVINGRLIVVTELADASLRDRYNQYVEQGQIGIPRDELLGYLRETADALDFLSSTHDLQHLDIKPENLLLLAGHIKVADFGLVKSVSNPAESLVGGMTPTYAAPEVFQGGPSRHSDQYSLAILYMELLTGQLPFAGANAAELTLQHLSDEPELTCLEEQDRFVIGRSLAKDPLMRFESCAAMVSALTNGDDALSQFVNSKPAATETSKALPVPKAAPAPKAKRSEKATIVFEGDDDAGWSDSDDPMLIELPDEGDASVRYTNAPALSRDAFAQTPALFIGLGGAGGKILRSLKRRVNKLGEGEGPAPTASMLLLDTAAKALNAATLGADTGVGLTKDETISLPLRRPQEYREKAPDLLRWLGRRWLYNIPRSLETEGIRPLGRLALVDHARRAFQRIRRAIVDTANGANDPSATNAPPQGLRIYLCGSITGATGGGMSLDVAYAVQAILDRLKLPNTRVIGVMTHSSSRDMLQRKLAQMNAYSWMAEWHHLNQTDVAYPGDEGCGLPAHEPGRKAFDATYLVDLGADADPGAVDAGIESVADYLYLDAFTPAQRLLDAGRTKHEGSALRTFTVSRRESIAPEMLETVATASVKNMLISWLGEEELAKDLRKPAERNESATHPVIHGAVQLVGRLKLDAAGLSSLCRALLEAHLGEPVEQLVSRLIAGADSRTAFAAIDSLFSSNKTANASGGVTHLRGVPLGDFVMPLSEKLTNELRDWLLARLETPGEWAPGARRATEWFADHLRALESALERRLEALQETLDPAPKRLRSKEIVTASVKRLQLLLEIAAANAALGTLSSLVASVQDVDRRVDRVTAALSKVLHRLPTTTIPPEHLAQQIEETTAALLQSAQTELLPSDGGILGLASEDKAAAFVSTALRQVERTAAWVCQRRGVGHAENDNPAEFAPLSPNLTCDGAQAWRMAVVPGSPDAAHAEHGDAEQRWTEVAGAVGASYFVVEASNLSAPRIGIELIGRRRDYATLGSRVHVRKDIRWGDLTEAVASASCPEQQPTPAEPLPAEPLACTQAIDAAPVATH